MASSSDDARRWPSRNRAWMESVNAVAGWVMSRDMPGLGWQFGPRLGDGEIESR